MANIKISQLPNISANLNGESLLPIVSTNGTFVTDKVSVEQLANFILDESGNLFSSANIATLSYDVINSAQPNITSVGNLTTLTVTGDVVFGDISQITIEGGSNGQVLTTDGNGELSWTSVDSAGATGATGPQGDKYFTTSTTSLTIGTGLQSLTVATGLAYSVTQDVSIAYDVNNYMVGTVSTYVSGNGYLQINVDSVLGSNTHQRAASP